MFLLNQNGLIHVLLKQLFTIQNVSIKLSANDFDVMKVNDLQYKMFLLNWVQHNRTASLELFTIQNVSIK